MKITVHVGEIIITLHPPKSMVIKSFGVRLLGFGTWSVSY